MQLKIMTSDGFKILSNIDEVRACPSHHARGDNRFFVEAIEDGGHRVLEAKLIEGAPAVKETDFTECFPDYIEAPGIHGLKPGEKLCVAGAFLKRGGLSEEARWDLAIFQLAYLMENGETIERIN